MSKRLTEIGFKNGTKIYMTLEVELVIEEWCNSLKSEAKNCYWRAKDMLIKLNDIDYIIPDEYLGEAP